MIILQKMLNFFCKEKSYATELEKYVLSKSPLTISDIERFTLEYITIIGRH